MSESNRARRVAALAAGLALLAAVCPAQTEWQPIALHPDNPHYFLWRGRPTVLVTSGEHYGAVLNLDFHYVRYLDALAADRLNHTRTFSGVYREASTSFRITDNTLAPKPGRYICPWARSAAPGYADGGNKFDLTRWDDAYFKRLKDFMRQAQRRGIVVEMNLFCPMYRDEMWRLSPMNAANNVNGIGACPRTEVYTLKHPDLLGVQTGFVRKIVTELREFDNLYYEVCNEPYFGGVTLAWQYRIINTIVKTEKSLGVRHLISMNIANGSKRVEHPHPAVSILNFHYCVPPDAVAANYNLNRVIGENETGFRGKADVLYRTEGWDFMLAGGALYSSLDYSFTARHPDGSFRDYKSPGGGSPELRRQLGILRHFMSRLPLLPMRPDDSVVMGIEPKLSVRALVEPGKVYAVYLHVPLPKKPRKLGQYLRSDLTATVTLDLPPDRYRVEWVDTKTGGVKDVQAFSHGGGQRKLRSPRFDNDIALLLTTGG